MLLHDAHEELLRGQRRGAVRVGKLAGHRGLDKIELDERLVGLLHALQEARTSRQDAAPQDPRAAAQQRPGVVADPTQQPPPPQSVAEPPEPAAPRASPALFLRRLRLLLLGRRRHLLWPRRLGLARGSLAPLHRRLAPPYRLLAPPLALPPPLFLGRLGRLALLRVGADLRGRGVRRHVSAVRHRLLGHVDGDALDHVAVAIVRVVEAQL